MNTQLLKARSKGMTYANAKGIKYQIDNIPPIPFKKITTKDLMKFLDSDEMQHTAGHFILQLNEPWYNQNNI